MELDEDLDEERVMVARETYLRASRAEQQGQLAEAVTLYKEVLSPLALALALTHA